MNELQLRGAVKRLKDLRSDIWTMRSKLPKTSLKLRTKWQNHYNIIEELIAELDDGHQDVPRNKA